MKLVFSITLAAFFIAIFGCNAEAKPWRGIVPVRSTRADVEKMLGTPVSVDKEGLHYDLKEEHVVFALARKDSLYDCAQRLPIDTVIRIAVTPTQPLTIQDIGLPENSFSRSESFEPQEKGSVLINDEAGLLIRVLTEGVDRIVYFAERKDQYLCGDSHMDPVLLSSRILCGLCPSVSVTCPDHTEEGTISFTSNVAAGDPQPGFTYHWAVSAGTIVEGQGTNSIKVDTKGLGGKTVTATVEVGGMDSACAKTASCSTPIIPPKN